MTDRTDTDTLPPPDGLIHGDVGGYPANKGNGYTIATARRLLAERDALRADAERYRLLRRGQRWSVINGIGDTLRADELDAAIDAARGAKGRSDATPPARALSAFTAERECCGTLLGSRHRSTCPEKGGPHA